MPKGKKQKSKNNEPQEEEKKAPGKLKTCNFVKARHILCEKQSKILEALNLLKSQSGNRPSPAEFGRAAEQFSECSTAKKGGDLGWFPRGKMIGAFQEVAFGLEPGTMSEPFRTSEGYHIVLVEGRRN
ncbi:hypothetical protein SteCoe_19698 [Stentor coeruleus]|uniref:Peptidyl-prolyl cis-trans isomerase n=1 Tax=Stentor coeruleus TaxID=5963 RepID=A0A1R2BTG1_9CILI|nr:hypothetical protein SteCoe_19698 [Stentor coeruleus]